ncbi:multiple coagulation factor deficiency protein 2-like protein [Leptotrombidium deliense]|uniref:Multiple coagulation factor deficiency protein 2-like protein n=1 Tax=Leptotrombidium deliense TaxID=299467 RepID=A0A443STQ6_9ACAR|nr:multiple coagulation factor deficiency protein 2-like protein [Leptotrombidium deliense]
MLNKKLTLIEIFSHLTEDIKEQLHVEIDPSKMTEEESQFYYFNLHDYDQNNKLDGLEVLLALQHDVPNQASASTTSTTPAPREVDDIMNNYDLNDDGYIEYDEFLYGRKKEMEKYGTHN